MEKRFNMREVQPAAYKAMLAMESYMSTTKLLPLHKELIKIRASQINGCAYCLDMHTKDARKLGETEQRIYVLPAWEETSLFTEEEKAILAITEEITLISHHVCDATYQKAASLFDQEYLAQIIMAAITINMWNRLAITTRLQPGEE